MIQSSKLHIIEIKSRIFWSMLAFMGAMILLYIYAVIGTSINTVARAQLETERSSLATNINEMEYKYIAEKNKLSINMALARGYKEVTAPIYLSREGQSSLSINLNH